MRNILYITGENLWKIAKTTNIPFSYISPSLNRGGVERSLFQPSTPIDIDAAVDSGFGVLELEDGQRFMFDETFNQSYYEKDEDYRELYEEDLALRIGMYLIVTDPNFYDETLDRYFWTAPERFQFLIPTEDGIMMQKIAMAFDGKRDQEVVMRWM